MAIDGCDIIMDQGEADALQFDALRDFESVKSAIESAPDAMAA